MYKIRGSKSDLQVFGLLIRHNEKHVKAVYFLHNVVIFI
jgi:hypothetical protein